jgi:dipeptidyl aminopeptidase/acylaminoacyl peptidase
VVACVLGLATANWPARAAFPGSNGKIVFTAYSEWGDLALFEIDADGSALTNPTTLSAEGYSPAFSPDGSTIAFMSTRDGNPEIYLIDADGSNLTRLTHNAASDVRPAFSADGATIAFISGRDGNSEIYTIGADGSAETRLTTTAANEDEPTFSPDGTRIAFTSDHDGNREIYVAAADGTDPVRLTADPAPDYAPDFSPDGSRIAFTSERAAGVGRIYVMGVDGSAPTVLTNGAQSFDHDPSFSPDGTKIAFASDFYCPPIYQCGDILSGSLNVINSDGTGLVTILGGTYVANLGWGVTASTPEPPPTTSPDTTVPPTTSPTTAPPTTSPDTTAPPTTTSPDTTPPETNITAGPTGPTNNRSPRFTFTGTDDRTATAQLQYAYRLDNGTWSTYSTDTTATLTVSDGTHTISVKARDEAGNEDPTPAQHAFTIDTVAPTGTVTIQGGALRTRTANVTLSLTASDPPPASGVTDMRVSNSAAGLTSAPWKPYARTVQWTLSSGVGDKTVYVQYRDVATNPSAVVQDAIKYKP